MESGPGLDGKLPGLSVRTCQLTGGGTQLGCGFKVLCSPGPQLAIPFLKQTAQRQETAKLGKNDIVMLRSAMFFMDRSSVT